MSWIARPSVRSLSLGSIAPPGNPLCLTNPISTSFYIRTSNENTTYHEGREGLTSFHVGPGEIPPASFAPPPSNRFTFHEQLDLPHSLFDP